jgi:hypothetical protein
MQISYRRLSENYFRVIDGFFSFSGLKSPLLNWLIILDIVIRFSGNIIIITTHAPALFRGDSDKSDSSLATTTQITTDKQI